MCLGKGVPAVRSVGGKAGDQGGVSRGREGKQVCPAVLTGAAARLRRPEPHLRAACPPPDAREVPGGAGVTVEDTELPSGNMKTRCGWRGPWPGVLVAPDCARGRSTEAKFTCMLPPSKRKEGRFPKIQVLAGGAPGSRTGSHRAGLLCPPPRPPSRTRPTHARLQQAPLPEDFQEVVAPASSPAFPEQQETSQPVFHSHFVRETLVCRQTDRRLTGTPLGRGALCHVRAFTWDFCSVTTQKLLPIRTPRGAWEAQVRSAGHPKPLGPEPRLPASPTPRGAGSGWDLPPPGRGCQRAGLEGSWVPEAEHR